MLAGMAVLGCLLFYLSAGFWGNLGWSREYILSYINEPLSENQAIAVMEQHLQRMEKNIQNSNMQEKIPDFCIWGQKEQVLLTNENLSRSIQADVILFCGSPGLLFEDCRVPGREDKQGCLIDEETAWRLFGSVQVTGKMITYENSQYIIRKIIPGRKGVAAFPAAGSSISNETDISAAEKQLQTVQPEQNVLNRVTIKKPQEQSVNELKTSWAGCYGVDIQILDMELLRGAGGVCVLLVPLTVCVVFLSYLCIQYEKQQGWKGRAVMLCLIMSLAVLALYLFGMWIQIPDEYIPAKWSDFGFWAQLIAQKQEAVRLLIRIPKSVLDYEWGKRFLAAAGFGLAAEALTVLTVVMLNYRMKLKCKK